MDPTREINKRLYRSPFPPWFKDGLVGKVIGFLPGEGREMPLVHIDRDGKDCRVAPDRLKLTDAQMDMYRKELEHMRNMLYSTKEGE